MNNSLGFFTMGQYFLNLAIATTENLIQSGNTRITVTTTPSSVTAYQAETRWSDHNIGVPILFNFYHGIELMLKGTILSQGNLPTKQHQFSELIAQIQPDQYTCRLLSLVCSVTSDIDQTSPLAQFFEKNGINPDKWYIALKYPEHDQKLLSHYALKYGETRTLGFWQSINELSQQILAISEEIYSNNPQSSDEMMPPES
ncbi:hypothetical protein ACOR62_09980 [Neisseria lisongii]|uniref:Uncharacterized protein n=1 Tax=Neisseria lisongii TaxID=2912188 RepID=A0AAW5AL25_9NEIS|nr:hypothetical protein [Neisseria lisongii]MCF7529864.1 hypothetical protein [Neisseria lisongii]